MAKLKKVRPQKAGLVFYPPSSFHNQATFYEVKLSYDPTYTTLAFKRNGIWHCRIAVADMPVGEQEVIRKGMQQSGLTDLQFFEVRVPEGHEVIVSVRPLVNE